MEFFDGWRPLVKRLDGGDLNALAQLVGYKLFAIFDEQRFPDSLELSDRELMRRTNIKSTQSIVTARRQLKNAGLIDFETAKARPTRYRLTLNLENVTLRNSEQTSFKQDSNKIQTSGLVPYTRVRDPFTAFPLKQKHDEEARARGSSETVTAKDNARANPLSSPFCDANAIQDVWEFETGYKLTGSTALELETLATEDFELVKQAIIASVKSKATDHLRYSYFRKIFDALKTQGSESNGSYCKPVEDDDADWRAYL